MAAGRPSSFARRGFRLARGGRSFFARDGRAGCGWALSFPHRGHARSGQRVTSTVAAKSLPTRASGGDAAPVNGDFAR